MNTDRSFIYGLLSGTLKLIASRIFVYVDRPSESTLAVLSTLKLIATQPFTIKPLNANTFDAAAGGFEDFDTDLVLPDEWHGLDPFFKRSQFWSRFDQTIELFSLNVRCLA